MDFAYSNEEDKSYGITGMVITLNVLDEDNILREISLDADNGEYISFNPDFFFCSNPRFSAKIAWNELVKQYQVLTGMLIGNVLCRHKVQQRRAVTREIATALRALVDEDGQEVCQLEKDEIDMMFNKMFKYISNLYDNSRVTAIAHRFASELLSRRTMSGNDALEQLQTLRRMV